MQILLSSDRVAEIDDTDVELVKGHSWFFDGRYAATKINGVKVYMHRHILQATESEEVDHKDRDKVNNKRSNLRVATSTQNNYNSVRAKASSLPRGVYKRGNLYAARIKVEGVTHYLGSYLNAEEAETAYKQAQAKRHGAFALTE